MTKLVEYHVIDPREPEVIAGGEAFTDDVNKLKKALLFDHAEETADAENLVIITKILWNSEESEIHTITFV